MILLVFTHLGSLIELGWIVVSKLNMIIYWDFIKYKLNLFFVLFKQQYYFNIDWS
jgi:hypothetical protein